MPTRESIYPAGRHDLFEKSGYAPAVKSNGFLFTSGIVGALEDGSPEPDTKKQITLAFTTFGKVLEAAGCTWDDVLEITMYHTLGEGFRQYDELFFGLLKQYFPSKPFPALTVIGSTYQFGYCYEMKSVVRLPA